jgi:hypothetical protein
MVNSRDELLEWLNASPFETHIDRDPDIIDDFPIIIKFMLIQPDRLNGNSDPVLILGVITAEEMCGAIEQNVIQPKRELDGYNYTESKKTTTAAGGGIEGYFETLSTNPRRGEVLGTFLPDNDPRYPTSPLSGYEESTGEA